MQSTSFVCGKLHHTRVLFVLLMGRSSRAMSVSLWHWCTLAPRPSRCRPTLSGAQPSLFGSPSLSCPERTLPYWPLPKAITHSPMWTEHPWSSASPASNAGLRSHERGESFRVISTTGIHRTRSTRTSRSRSPPGPVLVSVSSSDWNPTSSHPLAVEQVPPFPRSSPYLSTFPWRLLNHGRIFPLFSIMCGDSTTAGAPSPWLPPVHHCLLLLQTLEVEVQSS